MNTESLKDDLTGIVDGLIKDTLSESNGVLAAAIANDAALCAATGDKQGLAEVTAQAKLLAEQQRVKTNTAGWQAFEKVLGHVTAAAMAGVKAAVVLLSLVLMFGCTAPGTLSAGAVKPAVDIVTERHDVYVRSDANLTDVERERALRTSALLRDTVNLAAEGGE